MSFFNAAQQAFNAQAVSNNDRSYGNSQDGGNSQDRQTGGQDYNSGSSNNYGQQQQGGQYSNDVSSGYSNDVRKTGGQDYNSSNNGQQQQSGQYSNDVSSGYSNDVRPTGGQDYNSGSNYRQQQQGGQYSNDVSSGNSNDVRKTGGQDYNSSDNGQQSQGRYNTDDVLSHANSNDEDSGYISNALQHVQDNSGQHQDQVNPADMSTYGPMITKALSSVASKHGVDVSSLLSGSTGQGGGNQLMGMVMKEAGNFASSGGGNGQDKQSLMNGAAMTLTKLAAQGQLSSFTGGSNSGGLGGLAANMGKSFLQNQFGQ